MKGHLSEEHSASTQKWFSRSFVNKAMQIGTISVFLLLGLLFSTWSTTASVFLHSPYLKSTPPIHEQGRLPLPRLNIPVILQAIHDEQLATQIDRLLLEKMNEQQFSGSVLIAHDNHVILSKGYSMASWNRRQANTPGTRFYLGSVTKQFTAMAILILQQQGKLNVGASICTYIASCPAQWQPITIHELLTHTSGIPAVDDGQLSQTSPQAWINSLHALPLTFTPGSQFSYCNVCYQLLGYIVERVSGKPYSTFLQHAIFDPLHMKNTGFNPHYASTPNHADGYDDWQYENALSAWNLDPQWSFLFSAGLLYSTVGDIYRWDQALMHSTLVSQKTLHEAFTPYVPSQYRGSHYGYGWFLAQKAEDGQRLIWHDGKIPGFRTYNGFYPKQGVTLIVLSNLATLDEIVLASEIQRVIFA